MLSMFSWFLPHRGFDFAVVLSSWLCPKIPVSSLQAWPATWSSAIGINAPRSIAVPPTRLYRGFFLHWEHSWRRSVSNKQPTDSLEKRSWWVVAVPFGKGRRYNQPGPQGDSSRRQTCQEHWSCWIIGLSWSFSCCLNLLPTCQPPTLRDANGMYMISNMCVYKYTWEDWEGGGRKPASRQMLRRSFFHRSHGHSLCSSGPSEPRGVRTQIRAPPPPHPLD